MVETSVMSHNNEMKLNDEDYDRTIGYNDDRVMMLNIVFVSQS